MVALLYIHSCNEKDRLDLNYFTDLLKRTKEFKTIIISS